MRILTKKVYVPPLQLVERGCGDPCKGEVKLCLF